ncbi:MAG: T9SS type A sorting domain-containing protein [Bacteroidales bacterium]|nr:T9SS type A sorting domain-containing protein [Bacteroidales bacterium]
MKKITILLLMLVSITMVNAQYWRVYDGSTTPLAAPDGENLLTFEAVSDQCHGPNFYEGILEDPAIEGNMLLDYAEPDVLPSPCTSKPTARGMYQDSWNGMSDSSFTVIIRLAAKKGFDRAFDLQWRNGVANSRDELYLSAADSMMWFGKSDGSVKVNADLTKWHIYRVTVIGDSATVFMDEDATPVLTSTTTTTDGSTYIKMGDPGTGVFGAYIDYVAVDTTGAFDPVQSPIPAGLSTDAGGEMLAGFGKSVLFVTQETAEGTDGNYPDSMFVVDLKAVGFEVVEIPYSEVAAYGDALDLAVDGVDAVVIGRQVSSGDFQTPEASAYWEKLQKPLVCMSNYLVRANRLRWLPSNAVVYAARFGDLSGKVLLPSDPAFTLVDVPAADSIITYASDNIGFIEVPDSVKASINGTTLIELINGPEGYIVSSSEDLVTDTVQLGDYDGTPLMMRWAPLDSMYNGAYDGAAPARPFGYRTFIAGGDDHDWDPVAGMRNRAMYILSPEMNQVLANELLYLISLPQPVIDDDATLDTLYTDLGTWNPDFSADVNSYVVTYPEGTTSVTITAVANSENATVEGAGEFTELPGTAVITVTSMAGSVNQYNLVFQEEIIIEGCIPGGAGTLEMVVAAAEPGDTIILCNDAVYQIIMPIVIDKEIVIRAETYPELPGLENMPLISNDFAINPVIQMADGGDLTLIGVDIDGGGVSNIINPRCGGVGAVFGLEINRCRLHNTSSDLVNSGDPDQETVMAKCVIRNSFLYESGTGHGAYVRNYFGSNDPYIFEDLTYWTLGQQFLWVRHYGDADVQDWNFNRLTGYNLSTSVSDNKELFGNSPDGAELNIVMKNSIFANQVSTFEASLNFWQTADKGSVTLSNICLYQTSPAVPREGSDDIPVDPLYEDDPMFADPDNGDFTLGNTDYLTAADDGGVIGAKYWHPDFVDDFSDVLGIEQKKQVNDLSVDVYPVPFTSELNFKVNLETAGQVSLTIIDLSGRTLLEEHYQAYPGVNNLNVNTGSIQAGTYLYKISTAEGLHSGNLTKVE